MTFKEGDLVWAKVGGLSCWPARNMYGMAKAWQGVANSIAAVGRHGCQQEEELKGLQNNSSQLVLSDSKTSQSQLALCCRSEASLGGLARRVTLSLATPDVWSNCDAAQPCPANGVAQLYIA